jgi:hypothetical protein
MKERENEVSRSDCMSNMELSDRYECILEMQIFC